MSFRGSCEEEEEGRWEDCVDEIWAASDRRLLFDFDLVNGLPPDVLLQFGVLFFSLAVKFFI